MLKRHFETHIDIVELQLLISIYEGIVGLDPSLKEEGRRIAFYRIGGRAQ